MVFSIRYSNSWDQIVLFVFGIRSIFKKRIIQYSVFGKFLKTNIFGIRIRSIFTIRCNSGSRSLWKLINWSMKNKIIKSKITLADPSSPPKWKNPLYFLAIPLWKLAFNNVVEAVQILSTSKIIGVKFLYDCQALCPFWSFVLWTKTATKVTFHPKPHPTHHKTFFWSQMKCMAK